MRTRSTVLTLLAALLGLSLPLLAAEPAWRDSTRDVHLDGSLNRAVQVLSSDSGKKIAILLPDAGKALVLDREAGTFSTVPRKAFALTADGAGADLATDAAFKPAGSFRNVDAGSMILSWKGRTVLIARHQGLVGDVTEQTLFATAPLTPGTPSPPGQGNGRRLSVNRSASTHFSAMRSTSAPGSMPTDTCPPRYGSTSW